MDGGMASTAAATAAPPPPPQQPPPPPPPQQPPPPPPATTTTTTTATNISPPKDETKSTNDGPTSTVTTTTTKAPTSRTPQRKVSVFSQGGFKDIHQLDQETLRRRSNSHDVTASNQQHLVERNVSMNQAQALPLSSLAESTSTKINLQAPDLVGKPTVACDKAHRSNRTDTLGSTGSSRASSCDEPTIVDSSATKRQPRATTPESNLVLSASKHDQVIENEQQERKAEEKTSSSKTATTVKEVGDRRCSLATNATSSSSTSSLDSISDDWQASSEIEQPQQLQPQQLTATSTTTFQQQQQPTDEPARAANSQTTNSDGKLIQHQRNNRLSSTSTSSSSLSSSFAVATTTTARRANSNNIPPPFQSIKSQLGDGNTKPNAQLIQQHIDKIISQNDVILDNSPLVSPRSYSRSDNISSASATSTATPANRFSATSALQSNNSNHFSSSLTSSSAASQSASSQGRRPKRWSTTALGNPALLQRHQQQNHHHHHHHHHQQRQDKHLHVIPKLSVTSSNSSSRSSGFFSNAGGDSSSSQQQQPPQSSIFSPGHQKQPPLSLDQITNLTSALNGPLPPDWQFGSSSSVAASFSVPSSPKPNVSILDVQDFLNNRFGRGYTSETTTKTTPTLSTGAAAAGPIATAASTSTNQWIPKARSSSGLTQLQSIVHATENLSLKRPSEVAMSEEQRKEIMLTAALMYERQAQLPMSLGRDDHQQRVEAAILQQQHRQLLEHQLELIRLNAQLASMEQKQQPSAAMSLQQQQQQQDPPMCQGQHIANFMLNQQMQQLQRQIELRDATCGSNNNHNNISSSAALAYQQNLREHQARETNQLNEYLARMVDRDEDQIHRDQIQRQFNTNGAVHLGHGSELLTQSLDSSPPVIRCEPCDISFWSHGALNYHLLTSCAARTGPFPSIPISFNFNSPNGLDLSSFSNLQGQQDALTKRINDNLLTPPRPMQHRRSYQHNHQSQPSKSASPPRRRMTNDDELMAAHQSQTNTTTTTTTNQIQDKFGSLLRPDEQFRSVNGESSELAQANTSNELSILKQKLLTSMPQPDTNEAQQRQQQQQQTTAPTATSIVSRPQVVESLPFKKRKISEPNMRY